MDTHLNRLHSGVVGLFVLVITFFLMCSDVSGQSNPSDQIIENLLEQVSSGEDEVSDFQEWVTDWQDLLERPLNLNTANPDDLQRLHLLTDWQIRNFLQYRQKTGELFSVQELNAIEDFSPDLVEKVSPFLIVAPVEKQAQKRWHPRQDVLLRAGRRFDGSPDSKNEGSPGKFYVRYRFDNSVQAWGWTAEKDAGEAFFSGSNPRGFDYNSLFFNSQIGKKGSRLFLGDYTARFGQGLVVWQGFSLGKSSDVSLVMKSGQGIRSNTSTDENRFYRGISAKLNAGNWVLCPFVSLRKLDAARKAENGEMVFSTFQSSGYHRTEGEIAAEKSVQAMVGGVNLGVNKGNLWVGTTAVFTSLDTKMVKPEATYGRFYFSGTTNSAASADFKWSYRRMFLFGESAWAKGGAAAVLVGLHFRPSAFVEFSGLYRDISKKYQSFYASAFTESSRVNDENGFYIGVKVLPASAWSVSAYADLFRKNWLSYTTAAPSEGASWLFQLNYKPTRYQSVYLRLSGEAKEQKTTSKVNYNIEQQITRIRVNYEYQVLAQFSGKTRAEFVDYQREMRSNGFLLFQDFTYEWHSFPAKLNVRVVVFNTDDYNSRIYAYENDLLYYFAIPALSGNGFRYYLNGRVKLTSRIDFWLKFAETCYARNSLKIGQTQSDRNNMSELRAQVLWRF